MQIRSSQPSYSASAMTSLGSVPSSPPSNATEYTFDGVQMAVEPDGTVWRNPGSGWTVDANNTATLRMADAYSPGIVANAQTSTSGFDFNGLLQSLSQLAQTYITADAQHDLLQANIQRAAQGLPPLNAQAYMPGVNVGIADDTKKMLMYGGAALGAVYLLGQLTKRGR